MKIKLAIVAAVLVVCGLMFLFLAKRSVPLAGKSPAEQEPQKMPEQKVPRAESKIEYSPVHPLVESAREQIGTVIKYDTSYYQGGYPPQDRGACTDVIERALRANGYDLKKKIDADMEKYQDRYPNASDPNINFRRVANVKVFFDNYAQKLSTCVAADCFAQNIWQAGDIVTFDQIPGSLWHIAIISNKTRAVDGAAAKIPFLVHNYGRGTVEDDMLLNWPAPITGHYRIPEIRPTD